jgi:hypothetical protein
MRGQRVEWGFHLEQMSGTGGAADLAPIVEAGVFPETAAATSAEVNWDAIVISDVRSADEGGTESYHFALTQPNPGLVAGDALPSQDAVVIGLRTGRKGGRYRGRFYLPGVAEGGTTAGRLTGAQLTAVQGLAQALIDTWGPGGSVPAYRLVVYSPPSPPFVPKTAPPARLGVIKTPILSTDLDEVIRTQRRRAIGVGL